MDLDNRNAEARSDLSYAASPGVTEGLWSVIAYRDRRDIGHVIRSDIRSRRQAEFEARHLNAQTARKPEPLLLAAD